MIVGVRSLAEAIEYVTDADVKEELQYQYKYHVKPLLEKASKADEYEETAEELQRDLDILAEEKDDLEVECEELRDEVESLRCRLEELT